MPTPIPLVDYPGLIDLMLTGEEHSSTYLLDGVPCSVKRVRGHAMLEAISPDFGMIVVFPGWYAGEHGAPAHIVVVGEVHTCLQWLPLDRSEKQALIGVLPLSAINRTICRMAV